MAAAIPLEGGLGVVFAGVGEIDEFFDTVFGPLEIDVVTCEGGDTAVGVNASVAGAGARVTLHHYRVQRGVNTIVRAAGAATRSRAG